MGLALEFRFVSRWVCQSEISPFRTNFQLAGQKKICKVKITAGKRAWMFFEGLNLIEKYRWLYFSDLEKRTGIQYFSIHSEHKIQAQLLKNAWSGSFRSLEKARVWKSFDRLVHLMLATQFHSVMRFFFPLHSWNGCALFFKIINHVTCFWIWSNELYASTKLDMMYAASSVHPVLRHSLYRAKKSRYSFAAILRSTYALPRYFPRQQHPISTHARVS